MPTVKHPIQGRVERFDRWTSTGSWTVISNLDIRWTAPMLAQAALIESLYPEGEAGQVVLAEGLVASDVDARVGASDSLAETFRRPTTSSLEVWIGSADGQPVSAEGFRGLSGRTWAGKPEGALFTSPSDSYSAGAWFTYLLGHEGEHPRPWQALRLLPISQARIAVVNSAEEWCKFASHYPTSSGAIDWVAASQDVDIVTVTPRAAFSVDGISFRWEGRDVGPVWWSCATTVWLNWCVESLEQYELPK